MNSRRFDMLLLAAAFLLFWAIAARLAGPDALSTPVATLTRAVSLLTAISFWDDVAATGHTMLWACLIVLAGGLTAGLLVGSSRLATQVVEPMLGPLYSIPKITLYPVILLIFGLTPSATISFAAIHGIFPVMIFTINGIRQVPPIYERSARVMKLNRFQMIRSILIPAALPEIVAGLRVGFSTTLLGAIIAELFASTAGMGFLLIRATEAHDVIDIMAITAILFAFAITANSLLMRLERHVRHG